MTSAESIRQGQQTGREVWETQASRNRVNVGQTERIVSQVGGGALVLLGLSKGGLRGLVTAGVGAAFIARGASGHCSMYEALGLDTSRPEQGPYSAIPAQQGVRVEEATIIDRAPEDIYLFWRDHANLSRFMTEVVEVSSADGIRSHWVVQGPLGLTLEYDAEIHNDEPGRLISWRSLPGAQLATAGTVRFTPTAGGRGTEVRVNQKFDPPGGKLSVGIARLFGQDPSHVTRENLRRLKQLMEAGEIATTSGQPTGRA